MGKFNLESFHHFMQLFSGHETMYGEHIPVGSKEQNGKLKGKSLTKHGAVTEALYTAHLDGKIGLGVCPLREDNTVLFGAIDIDVYDGGVDTLLPKLVRLDIPLVPFRSKSGGLHLYLFMATATSAEYVKNILSRFVSILGLPNTTEVFPKQTSRSSGGNGNWINLPYFNCDDGTRKIQVNGIQNFEQAMDYSVSKRRTPSELDNWFKALPLSDAPCCLQNIWLTGDLTKNRNMFLFEIANYAKAKGGIDNYKEIVLQFNALLPEPLSEEEIERTVFHSHDKQTYRYACRSDLLKPFCDKQACRTRDFGKDSGNDSNLDYGLLKRYKTTPVYWEWEIDGVTIPFTKAEQFSTQRAFIHKCMEHLYQMPKKMADDKWLEVLDQAFSNMEEVESDLTAGADAFYLTSARDRLIRYCTNRLDMVTALNMSLSWASEDWTIIRFNLDALSRNVFSGRGDSQLLLRKWVDTLEPVPIEISYKGSSLIMTEIKAVKLFKDENEWRDWAAEMIASQDKRVTTVDKVESLFAQYGKFRENF